MRRRFSILLMLICLPLLLLVIGLCIRGQWATDWYQWHWTNTQRHTWTAWDVVPGRSGVYLSYQFFWFERDGEALNYAQGLQRVSGVRHVVSDVSGNPYSRTFWNRIGFGIAFDGPNEETASAGLYRYTFDHGHVPYWFLILVLTLGATPGMIRLYRNRRSVRRRQAGQCIRCGYDLRESPERCPECGMAR